MFELLCSCTSLFTREVAWAGSLGSGLHVWPVPTWEEPGEAFLRVWGQDQHPHEGHMPLPAGWSGAEELRFPTDFSRTVCANGPEEEWQVNSLLVGTGGCGLAGNCYLQSRALRMNAPT